MTNREFLKHLLDDRSEEGADQLSERLNCQSRMKGSEIDAYTLWMLWVCERG